MAKTTRQVGFSRLISWVAVLMAAGFLGWRIIVINFSQQMVRTGTQESAKMALAWAPANPHALYARGVDLAESDPEQAQELLQRAIWLAPGDGRAFALLGRVLERRGEIERAEQVMLVANKLAPRDIEVQAELTGFWGRRNQLGNYFRHLVTVAELDRRYGERVRPALLAVVDNPQYSGVVREVLSTAIADRDLVWWRLFFRYAARHAKNLDTVRLLYSIREGSSYPPNTFDRQQFLLRLERDREWFEAYFLWLNALDNEHLNALGNVFNGGFSLSLMNQGFAWRYRNSRAVDVSIATIEGASDGTALRVRYSGSAGKPADLGQYLVLPVGRYELSGRIRSIMVDDTHKVRWRVDCMVPQGSLPASPLLATDYFLGTETWRVFAGQFEVPSRGCDAQRLYMEQQSIDANGKMTRSTLWFDDITIRNLD